MVTHVAVRHSRPALFSRAILCADGVVAGASGLLLLARAQPLSMFLGLEPPLILTGLGALLAPYGAWLAWTATRQPSVDLRRFVRIIALGNSAWVLASALILLSNTPRLTAEGKWMTGVVAVIVADFALLQFYGASRLRSAAGPKDQNI